MCLEADMEPISVEQACGVVAVHRSAVHSFSKQSERAIELRAALGVVGDTYSGVTVQHLSRVAGIRRSRTCGRSI